MSSRVSLIVLLSFISFYANAQTFKILHEGPLTGKWIQDPANSEFKYAAYYTNQDNVGGSVEDKRAQLFINYMVYGGINLGVVNFTLNDYYANYIATVHFNEWVDYTRANSSIKSEEYFKLKYGASLPTDMRKIKINEYEAIYYVKENIESSSTHSGEQKSYYFFIFIDGERGVRVESFNKTAEGDNTTYDDYENLMLQHLREMRFTVSGSTGSGDTSTVGTSPVSEDNDIPWTIIIGVLSAGVVAAIIRKLIRKKADPSRSKNQEDKNKEEEAHYILQLNKDIVRLTLQQPEILQIRVWKVTTKGKLPVGAQISIQNPENNLKISSQADGNGLTAQLLLEKQSSQPQFNLVVNAVADGKSIQKMVEIIAEGKKQIIIETEPGNKRTLRPGTNQILTCYAQVVDETGQTMPELTKKIQFKPLSDWIDLSNPVMEKNHIIINVAASDPDQVNPGSNTPKKVTLSVTMDDVKDTEEPLQADLLIELLDCKLETDVSQCTFPVSESQTQITINAFIENAPGDEPWTFEAEYRHAAERVEPLSHISISKKSDSEAEITLSGPIEEPGPTETMLSRTLVISAYQGNEKPLERHIKVMVTQAGLFVKNGTDGNNQISYQAQGEFERDIEFVLYKFDKNSNKIILDKEGLKRLSFTLQDEEQDIINFASVLKVSFDFEDLVGNIPYGRYKMKSQERIPGFGNVFTLTYLVEAPYGADENPEQFQLELKLKVKTYGIGSEFPEWVEAYNNCKRVIIELVPNGETQAKLYELLEARKYTLGAEGLNELRKRIWKIAYNLILAEGAEGYKSEESWAGIITTTLEWTEWAGDLAYNALVGYCMNGNVIGSLALSMGKAHMVEALNYYVYEKDASVDGFIDLQYQKILPFLLSVSKGRLISMENIEMVVKKNKPLAVGIFISCEFLFNLFQTKSVVEAAKITAAQLRDELIIQKLTLHLQKNQLKYNIKLTTIDESLKDVAGAVKTKDGKQYIELEKVIEIMRDPAQVRTLKNHAPDWLKKVFDDSRSEIYKKHDKDLTKHLSATLKIDPEDIKIDDFRTPGTSGSFNLNTDRDYRVLRKVKTSEGQEIWIELQQKNWIDKSYEIFGEHTKKPYGISDKEWAEHHLQRATDRFDAEAGKDYSDHIYNKDTNEILTGEPNIVKVKHGEGTLYDAEGIGKMYQNKVNNALEPGTIPEAFAQAQKAVESLDKVKKSYTSQQLTVSDTPQNLKDAMEVIRNAKTDVQATPEAIRNLNNQLNNLGYNDVGEVARDIAIEFKNLKQFDNKSQVFTIAK